ncbi:SCO family protein [Methylotetracoccus oryzae]|uniref:SCO family protein n=1 Tax=Methylotetracoccus oryzae TaxID=1919059 RepID=UPI001119ED03|nr:SCO family protein [Methylotetracoccus oryzae]
MKTRRDLLVGIAGVALAGYALSARRSLRAPALAQGLPNTLVQTHDGRSVRFYDDLIRGKIAVINMMYTRCENTCPLGTRNLLRLQQLLGERVGRDVFMYSITLKPDEDDQHVLMKYAERHRVQHGWTFLTAGVEAIRDLRYHLGFVDPDPLLDDDSNTHTAVLRIGNDAYRRWTMAPVMAEPDQILATVNHVDRTIIYTG